MSESSSVIEACLAEVLRQQTLAVETQREKLITIAGLMAELVARDGRIFLFGTGHSHMLVEEAYFRAGGLAAAVPIFKPQVLMLHESAYLSSRLERLVELAGPVLDEYDPQPGELLFIFAASGSNALPVQMASEARRRGVITVGVCSLAYAAVAPLSAAGAKLPEVVDFVLDNYGEPGDAALQVPGSAWRTAPTSTLVGALLWNCLLAETVTRLVQAGHTPPIFASYNMDGAIEHNRGILEKWSRLNPHLPARTIRSNR